MFFVLILLLFTQKGISQELNDTALFGTWEIQGTLMGENGEGWLAPHNHAGVNCEKDYSQFSENYEAKDVRYDKDCKAITSTISWKLDGNTLILTKEKQKINWLIHSLTVGKMVVGIPIRPGSDKRMYVVYKKQS